jgi:hypothetical protein
LARKFYNGIDLQNNRGINAASPSMSTDIVNKSYVDNLVNGLSWKDSVQAATTASAPLTTAYVAGQVIDGYTLVLGDSILIKNQTVGTGNGPADNGIYIVQTTGAPVRRADAVQGELTTNATVRVNNGSVNVDSAWTLTTTGIITVGTTNQTWVQSNAGTPYAAGNGLSLTAQTFAVVPGSGILADGTSTRIDPSVVVRKFSIAIGDGSTTTYTVTHGLSTQAVLVSIFNSSTFEEVDADVVFASTSTITVTFAVAPATNAYTVVVHG